MRLDVDARVATAAHDAAMTRSIEAHEAAAVAALDRIIRRFVRQGVARFRAQPLVAAAGDVERPRWRVPIPVDLLDEAAMEAEVEARAVAHAEGVATTTSASIAASLGIDFDQSNRLLNGVIAKFAGGKITTAPKDLVGVLMTSLQKSYDEGHSIPRAARKMREAGYAHSRGYAERIARTELIGAVNAASLAQIQGATTIPYKLWMATNDKRTRPHHREADGQTVPIDSTFVVGGHRLEYPGDPNGPGEEVIMCRCTMGYTDEPRGLATIAGGRSMATAVETETEDAPAVGASWSGTIAQEGVDTGDGRRIEANALAWRELPIPLMAQLSDTHGGFDPGPTVVAGRIDSIDRAGENIVASGVFDTGDDGAETERLVREGMLRGVSIDLRIDDAELLPDPEIEDPMEAMFMGTLNILAGTILGATVVPFPAFENASIAIVAGAAMRLRLRKGEDGSRLASFVMPFAPFPPAAGGDGDAADDEEDDGSGDAAAAIADIRDAVNGHAGLDGKVVVTIDGDETTINFPAEEAADDEAAAARINADALAALAVLTAHFRKKAA